MFLLLFDENFFPFISTVGVFSDFDVTIFEVSTPALTLLGVGNSETALGVVGGSTELGVSSDMTELSGRREQQELTA